VRFENLPLPTWTGEVEGVDAITLPDGLSEYDCRNNRLAWLGLQQDGFLRAVSAARTRWGAGRVSVFLGTSTSGLLQTEIAYRERGPDGQLPTGYLYGPTQNTYSVADFAVRALGLSGPSWVVSTACSSSAKVFGNAARLIAAGLIDAAVVGGVDSLCLTTLYGFNSLELLSSDICRPWDGVGESNDGHHMSTPHPEGAGAIAAMRSALADAGLGPADIDYINLHGTATPSNDTAEDHAVSSVFGTRTPCSSTKGATGHTLGAAGGVEALVSMLSIENGLMPAGLNVQQRDPDLCLNYLLENRYAPVRRVLSNSFGFGGSNASLVFGASA
jgi:3-oxoacyl-[acyl-carrier-protein] synthase-1